MMEQSIADLLKDVFSEDDIDFEHLQTDEGTNTSQTQLNMDENMDDQNNASTFWTSEQSLTETITNEQEESETSESQSSNSLTNNTKATFCQSNEVDNDQVLNTMVTDAQLNNVAGECIAEEENMQSDLAADVYTHGLVTGISTDERMLTEEEGMETFNAVYQPQTSPPMSSESQTPEETSSESDEELLGNSSITEQSSQCESVGNKDEPLLAMSPNMADTYYVRDDMKEFTEEDQEQIEESLADYPSDLSHSETEEPADNVTAHPFTLFDSSIDEHSTDRIKDLSNADNVNLYNKDNPVLDYNSGIKVLGAEMISTSTDINESFQRGSFDEGHVQESLTNVKNTEEDATNMPSDEADHISGSSSDDHSTNQEETNFLSPVKQEEERNHVTSHEYTTEDLMKTDNDIGCICLDAGDEDTNSSEKQDVGPLLLYDVKERGFINTTEHTELHHSTEAVQSDTAINAHDKSETPDNVRDAENIITEAFWSSALLMNEDNLCLDEYDWDLNFEDPFKINSGGEENQEGPEDALEELNIDEEGNERDWELEKMRIEAFYQFYGDQTEAEDKVDRNHKVSFCLDHESSEYDEESDSTEEEPDSDLYTPDFETPRQEYHSESDDPLEKPYYLERSRMQQKEQQPVNAAVKQQPHRNKCLAVLKYILVSGLLTAIGIVSFWWTRDNLDWIH